MVALLLRISSVSHTGRCNIRLGFVAVEFLLIFFSVSGLSGVDKLFIDRGRNICKIQQQKSALQAQKIYFGRLKYIQAALHTVKRGLLNFGIF